MINYPNCEEDLLNSFQFINEFKNCKSFQLENYNKDITFYKAERKGDDINESKVYSPR